MKTAYLSDDDEEEEVPDTGVSMGGALRRRQHTGEEEKEAVPQTGVSMGGERGLERRQSTHHGIIQSKPVDRQRVCVLLVEGICNC